MEEIDNFGATRIEDVLNTFPQIETSSNNFNPGGDSVATLDLRGLGASRTLVLLNGRRLQPGSIYSESPDVGQIPVALLERVDILTGGASAVYGSDAIGGVVNFITKHHDGLSITMSQAGYSIKMTTHIWKVSRMQKDILIQLELQMTATLHHGRLFRYWL